MAAILIPLAISAAITAASTGLEYLLAKKQKIPTVDKGKVDDIRFSLPGYGESIIWSRGRNRAAPTWFWHTPTVDVPVTTPGHSGGKGAPKQTVATVIEHRYFKSLAGVFHDGEIQRVRRIWFNSDLVWNLFGLSSVRYEAELATLNGTATIVNASYASAGRGVTHLGVGGGDNGSVDFSVTVPGAGDYDIAIYYQLDTGSMSFEVSVDSVLQGVVSCPANGPSVIGVQAIGLTLTGGSHVIRLGNTSSHAPNLDCIDVVQTVSFENGSTEDNRTFTELIDPTASSPADTTKAWATYNAQPLEVDENGSPQAGTSTITGTLSKWGNPQIRIYRGTTDQVADPAIVANKGAGNVPAWRGLAYIVIENILLPNAQVPNVTIEWDQGTSAVDTIVQDLYALGGVSSGDLDLTALSGLTITGAIRTEQKAIGETLKDLQTRFQFDMVEVDGKVKAILRSSNTPDLTIPFAKLRAHPDGSEMPTEDAIIRDIDPRELPYEVQVNYLDPGNDFHNGVQMDNRASGPQTQPVSVSLALVDNKDNMKKLASKLLYKPDMEGREFTIQTGPEYLKAIPGTIIDLVLSNATHRTRVVDAKYGLPAGVCEFQLVRQAASLYSATGFGSISGREPPIAGFPSNTKGIILDGPLFRPEDAGDGTDMVLYLGMCQIGGGSWPGAFLLQENPFSSGNYELQTSATIPSGVGVTSGTLASVSDPSVWDTTSTLVVNFYYDPQLSNATTTDIENNPNLNLLAIKNPSNGDVEVVQFKNATPGAASSPYVANYTLDHFLRGRFETENNVGSHTSADEVAFIDSTIKPRRQRKEDIGKTLNFKFQTSGQFLDSVPVYSLTLYGNSTKPHAVTSLAATRDSSGDWYISAIGHPRTNEFPTTYTSRLRRVSDGSLLRDIPVSDYAVAGMFAFVAGAPTNATITNNNIVSTHASTQTPVMGMQRITDTNCAISGKITLSPTELTNSSVQLAVLRNGDADSFSGYASVLVNWHTTGQFAVTAVEDVDKIIGAEVDIPTVNGVLYFTLALVGSEFKFYTSGAGVPVPGTTLPTKTGSYAFADFPDRLRISVNGFSKVENIWISGLSEPHTIYALRQQAADLINLGVAPATAAAGLSTIDVQMWQNPNGRTVRKVF